MKNSMRFLLLCFPHAERMKKSSICQPSYHVNLLRMALLSFDRVITPCDVAHTMSFSGVTSSTTKTRLASTF
ncbi:hypothetical protein QQP08_025146 [Theobroma cacao]|nr:hypothetical protein QQP08_025146 [Theobroma cacao]